MKFLITSKDQTDGTKQKVPLYKYMQADLELKQQPLQYDVLQHPNIKTFCQQCQKDITICTIVLAYGSLEQSLEEEKKQDLDIATIYCVGCFSNLSVFPQKYLVRKNLKYTFTNSSWNLFDEMSLLNSLQIWGFGNWNQVKDFMDYNGSTFSLQQIESHYEQVYLKRNGADIKNLTINNQPIAKKKQTLQQIQHRYYFSCLYQNQNKQEMQKQNYIHQQQNPFKRDRQNSLDDKIKLNSEEMQAKMHQQINIEEHHGKGKFIKKIYEQQDNHIHQRNGQIFCKQDMKNIKRTSGYIQSRIDVTVYQQQDERDENQNDDNQNQNEQQEPQSTVQLKPRSSFMKIFRQSESQKKNHHSAKGLSASSNLQSQRNLNQISNDENLKGNNIYSYNPKRKEFQIIEYDYYAESMLAYLQFNQQESQQQQNVKIQIIKQYNKRLDQRKKRRQFVIEHRLLDNNFHFTNIKNLKQGAKKFEPFRRFTFSLQEYQNLLKIYGEQIKLKRIIQGLKKLRSTSEKGKMKQVLSYIEKKKEKKMLLGCSEKLNTRKVYQNQKDFNSISKKLILVGNKNESVYNDLRINNNKNTKSNANLGIQEREFNLAPSEIDYLQRKINLQKVQEFYIGNFKICDLKKKQNRFQNKEK